MIKGIDIGNYSSKDEKGNIFESRITTVKSILGNRYNFTLDNELYEVGKGTYDTTYRKVDKNAYMKLIYAWLCISNADERVQIVLGLPISQYKQDKSKLIDKIKSNFVLEGTYNGIYKRFVLEDVEVWPEGIASLKAGYEGVLVDIGGRTTDACMINRTIEGVEIEKPISIPKGTLNLYNNFINLINSYYGLDLEVKDAEKIIKQGLKIKGERQNISFAIETFKEYLEELIRDLRLNYNLEINNITFTGGGSLLLEKPILNRLSYAEIDKNALFSNAIGFYKRGVEIWESV